MRKNLKKAKKILRVLKIPKKSKPSFNPSSKFKTIKLVKLTAERAVQTEQTLPSPCYRVMSLSVPNLKFVLFSVLEQQKRRRFHPLRNLRRIFRRRTITSADDSPAAEAVRKAKQQTTEPVAATTIGSASEKNLRSATLSSISSVVSSSASSPSSPLAHQLLQTLHGNTNGSRSPVKSCSHGNMLLAPKSLHKLQQEQLQQQVQNQNKQLLNDTDAMYATNASSSIGSATTYHQRQQHAFNMSTVTSKSATNTALVTSSNELQSISALSAGHRSSTMGGIAVLPGAFNAAMSHSFFAERQKLKSLGDSSQELDSSANSSLGSSSRRVIGGNERNAVHVSANGSGGEMTDSQRSFSEGRLVDSDYSRDGLSQSHDSVFSESATASSLSIVLKAELADALRKRRNRPDASDEDLGLPRSPASPQRRSERNSAAAITTTPTTAGNQSDVSSLSMLSMNSTEGDSMLTDSTANATLNERSYTSMTSSKYSRNSTMNSSSSDILRPSSTPSKSEIFGEVDLFSSDWQRLSHSAAKHKMAVRPTKKKGPSRQHRRTLETSIPEANEDLFRISSSQLSDYTANKDARSNIQSTPPVASAKPQQQSGEKHLETKKQDTADEPRKNQIKSFEGKRGNDNKRSKMDVAKPEIAAKPSPSPSTTSFGLRTLTAKASAIFESRNDNQLNDEREKVEDNTKISQPVQQVETTESGFLRRLIQRNSKRTLPKATNFEDSPDSQSEPKKLQISTSVYEPRDTLLSSRLSQTQSAIAYDQQVEQTRKEIKREILSEAGLGVMLSPYLFTNSANDANPPRKPVPLTRDATTEAFQKPKSGPAARQRYLPQDILSSSSVEKTNPSASLKVPLTDTVSSITNTSLSKSGHEETFQSISIIREITATQSLSSAKSEHHLFEKKPKIIGLSAFQQKISRANESHLRSQSSISSSNSLEVKDEGFFLSSAEQKQRKSVEKSRSFRTYNADKELDLTNSVRSNMPSLPDLSLRLPTFNEFILNEKEYSSPSPPEYGDKCVSLGFEINDNNLVRPSSRAESASSLGKATCKLSAPTTTILPSLSPTNSCSNNISEIEQNIDKIVKSPYVSLMRKSATVSEEMSMKTPGSAKKLVEPTSRSEMHPNSLAQPKEAKFIEPKASPTKTQHAAPIRNHTITIPEKLGSELSAVKEAERKSIAASNPATASKISTNSRPRRSASVVESSTPESTDTSIPEFLKIQLNRVDPGTRAPKSTVVLAKNVKEPSTVVAKDIAERSVSNDDLSLRRYSTESLEIVENEKLNSPERPSIPLFEAINKQTKSLSTNSIQSSSTHSEPTPKTITIKKHPATPTSQTPPILLNTANVNTAGNNNYSTGTTPTEEVVVLRHKPPIPTVETTATTTTTTTTSANKLSLQERKRLFMNEDKTNADKKIEELKNERKKSISEELQRKSSCSGNNKIDLKESTAEESSTEKEPVIMRKKSFGVAQQTNALHTSINNINNNINNNTTTSSSATNRDDATPELMKVFARRSLKVKDEDLVNLADKIISAPNSTSIALKKSTAGQSNVDSDKENQSASEEKLDKISKFETHGHLTAEQMNGKMLISNTASSISLGSSSVSSTRSSMTDFRSSVISYKNGGNGKALALNCNNNNNNSNNSNNINNSTHSNNNNNSLNSTATLSTKCSLPSLRVGSGLRSLSNANEQRSVSECVSNNNNINNHNNSQNSFNNQAKSSLERQSLCMRGTTNVADSGSKTIERSATVGEFKGILQRRAEWEQRAKEALK